MMIIQLLLKKRYCAELRKVADSSDFDGPCWNQSHRWATHGVPNHENSHPHQSSNGGLLHA